MRLKRSANGRAGTARLEEAVAAYRAALEERTRERVPLDWATTQNNLGNALTTLGERESGTARLEEAVAAYRAALEELTRERVPLVWASDADESRQRALNVSASGRAGRRGSRRRSRPIARRWRNRRASGFRSTGRRRRHNLGTALAELGERESGTARLEEAVAAYREALEERTRERVPLDWAASLGNQGVAMMLIADRTNDRALAETAAQQIETADETLRSGGQRAMGGISMRGNCPRRRRSATGSRASEGGPPSDRIVIAKTSLGEGRGDPAPLRLFIPGSLRQPARDGRLPTPYGSR